MTVPRVSSDPLAPCGVRTTGLAVNSVLDYALKTYGPTVVAELGASLPAVMGEPIARRQVPTSAWVPVEMYFGCVQYLVKRFHGGDVLAARAIGKATAEQDIGAFFKTVLAFSSPKMIISLSGRFWTNYYDRGAHHIITHEDHRVVGDLTDWPLTDELVANEIAGSFLAYLEHSRAANVRVETLEAPAPRTLRFSFVWD